VAHQKVPLDEAWLEVLLRRPSSLTTLAGESSAARGQDSSASSAELALWTVPYARNPHFTGRDDLLSELTAQFAPPAPDQPTALRCAALTQAQVIEGLGGIGKTQIAVEYAYRARDQGRYTHTLWIAAANEEAILMSFVALAELLPGVSSVGETDQRKLVAAVLRWLEQCKEPWLLIVDNADDLSSVQPYLPLQGNGSVLLTTRASAVGWLASSLEVDTMGVLEGAELLLRRAQRLAHATEEEINEAANLVVTLGQFPLALDQAGAYIEETGCSLADYLQLYHSHRSALLSRRGRQAVGYPASVATTWSLSFEHVAASNPAAAELLRLCAFLAPDTIPEELLTHGAPYWPPTLQEAAIDRFHFNQALETLLAFSLVKRLAEDHLLSVHRLVQVVQQDRLAAVEQRQWAERLIRAVNLLFPRDPKEVGSWPLSQRYLDQVQVCDALIQEHHLTLFEGAELLDRVGTFLHERALYTLAEPLFQRALSIWEEQDNPQPLNRTQTLSHLANLYAVQGKYAEAESLYWQAIEILEQKVGSEHTLLGSPLRGLAHVYTNQGKYAQAEPLYKQALRLLEQQWSPDSPEVFQALNGLAFVHLQQGNYAQAELLSQRALRILEQQYGPEHPTVAFALIGLALVHTQRREYAQAESLYQRVIRIREQQLGPEHPLVATALHELAKLYAGQGKYAQADPLFQRALRIRERLFGPNGTAVADTLRGLADLHTRQEEYARAEPLYQRALRIREQQFGPEHLEMAEALQDFADFQHAQGHASEVAQLYQRVLAIRETIFGPEHPQTVETRARLQAVLAALDQRLERAPTAGESGSCGSS
jgi:tetratricopeptide (TPR) repeat protein